MDNNTFAQRDAQPEHALHTWIADAYNNCARACTNKDDRNAQGVADGVCEFAKTAALYTPGIPGRIATATLYAVDEINLRDSKNAGYDLVCGALKGTALWFLNELGYPAKAHPLIQGATLGLASRLSDVALTRSTYQHQGQDGFDAWYGLQNISAELTNRPALVTDIASFGAASALSKMSPGGKDRICEHIRTTISGSTFGFIDGATQEAGKQRSNGEPINWAAVARSGMTHASISAAAANFGRGFVRSGTSELCRVGTRDCFGRTPQLREEIMSTPSLNERISAALKYDSHSYGKMPIFDSTPLHTSIITPSSVSFDHQEHQLLNKFGNNLDIRQSLELSDALDIINRRIETGNLSSDTIKHVYQQTEKLLEPESLIPQVRGAGPLLAKQFIVEVADPSKVHQGNHPSCTVAALEHRMLVKDPEKAGELIVQAVTTATYKPPFPYEGKELTVRLDPYSLIAEHTCIDPYGADGMHRSYASQILQYVAPNVRWQAQDPNLRYERGSKTREFTVRDFGKLRPELLHDYPHLGPGDTTSIYEAITGNGTRCHYSGNNFRSQREFKDKLMDAKQQNQLPLIFSVDVRQSPFYELVGEATRRQLTAADHTHDICVTEYNPKNGMVSVYNSWGRQFHPSGIPLETLYKALERSR